MISALGGGAWHAALPALGASRPTRVPRADLLAQIEHYNYYLSYGGYALLAVIVVFIAYNLLKKKK